MTDILQTVKLAMLATELDVAAQLLATKDPEAMSDEELAACLLYTRRKLDEVDEPAAHQADQQKASVTKKSVLETAIQTVADRGVPYGGVEDNFQRIANLWNAHLLNRFSRELGDDVATHLPTLDPSDVAMMMALMKIARLEANPGHADSWVDVAGYAACGGEIGAKISS